MDGKTLGEMCKVRFEIPLGLKNTEMLMDYIQNNSSLEVSYTPSYHINYVQTLNGYARQRTGIALEGTITNPETHTFSEFNGVTCERDSKNKLHDTNRFSSIEFALTSELTDISRAGISNAHFIARR